MMHGHTNIIVNVDIYINGWVLNANSSVNILMMMMMMMMKTTKIPKLSLVNKPILNRILLFFKTGYEDQLWAEGTVMPKARS